ncbi:MAG: hypothetical protein SFU85_05975 [Candidatus Methylacidiphilales bacterium]|nr:hypothetical protein [Candidatus Methylacidiphilales bacterium]
MPVPRPGLILSLILGAELAAFVILWLTGSLERLGPTLVAVIMIANLLFILLAAARIARSRRPPCPPGGNR